MWLVLGFASLGLLVGSLVGLTASSVVTSVLGLLFAFAGGSVLSFIHKIGADDRKVAGKTLVALSLSCLVGIYSALYVSEYRLLTPASRSPAPSDKINDKSIAANSGLEDSAIPSKAKKYIFAKAETQIAAMDLLSTIASEADDIDKRYRAKQISAPQAYQELSRLVARTSQILDEKP